VKGQKTKGKTNVTFFLIGTMQIQKEDIKVEGGLWERGRGRRLREYWGRM
jgi:hypothetical protein